MEFLKERNSSALATYGHEFKVLVKGGYHSGGCGYLLTGAAFRLVGHKLVTNRTYCQNTGIDDVDLAACLRTLGVVINSSLDEIGRERFIPVNFLTMYNNSIPSWMFNYSAIYPKSVCFYLNTLFISLIYIIGGFPSTIGFVNCICVCVYVSLAKF